MGPTHATLTLEPLGPFSLEAAARFWGGFTPAGHTGLDAQGHLHMAFPLDGTWSTVGVCLRSLDGSLTADVYGEAELQVVRRQTARILSLDVDGRALPDVARRDAVAADLLERFPGLRPVCFYSPYEAAVWAIVSHRIQMRQASAVKARLTEAFGQVVSIHGQSMRAFPSPRALSSLADFPGLFGRKPANIAAVAAAPLAGDLDADRLRALPDDLALAHLQELPGIGPFSSELILLRGAGHPDYLTLLEPRFRRAVHDAYALDHEPTDADLRRISEAWRPYRMWITFLLRQSQT
ncbi:MAG: DNA-3-methyladenine glycosylase 2 family protein [Chloroflexi bacterium]|nr:DNA-3-methyladenine glycosylase 2 family protein [Chloroflexota bacterium]